MRKIDRYEMCVDSECTGKWRWFNGDLLVFSPDIHVGAIADAGDSCVVFRRINGATTFRLDDLFCGSPRHYLCYWQF